MGAFYFMEIKFTISVDDLLVIKENMSYFQQFLPRFKIISDNFEIDDPTFVEYDEGVDMFSFKEAVFELDNLNNFWTMAKLVQQLKIEKL